MASLIARDRATTGDEADELAAVYRARRGANRLLLDSYLEDGTPARLLAVLRAMRAPLDTTELLKVGGLIAGEIRSTAAWSKAANAEAFDEVRIARMLELSQIVETGAALLGPGERDGIWRLLAGEGFHDMVPKEAER